MPDTVESSLVPGSRRSGNEATLTSVQPRDSVHCLPVSKTCNNTICTIYFLCTLLSNFHTNKMEGVIHSELNLFSEVSYEVKI